MVLCAVDGSTAQVKLSRGSSLVRAPPNAAVTEHTRLACKASEPEALELSS